MPILNTLSVQTGLVGVLPSLCYIYTDDPVATVTTAGYLNKAVENGFSPSLPCLAVVSTQENSGVPVVTATYALTHAAGDWTLSIANTGEVIGPVVAGHFANWANTSGALLDAGYSPTTPSLAKVVMVQPNNSGASPLVANIPVFFDVNGSICEQQPGQPSYTRGPLYVSSASQANRFGIALSSSIASAFGGTLVGLANLAQNTNYFMVDPAVPAATMAMFAENPAITTPGHLIVAGTVPGTLADGGSAPTGFVAVAGTSRMDAGSFIQYDTAIETISGSAVTINKQSGRIQTNSLTTAGGAQYQFTFNNSLLTATSNIQLTLQYGSNTTVNIECVLLAPPTSGSCNIVLINNNAAALNGDMMIYFFVTS